MIRVFQIAAAFLLSLGLLVPTYHTSAAIANLTPSTQNIHLGLMQNQQLPPSIQGKSAEVGVDDYVWGAQSGSPYGTNIPASGVHHTLNMQWGRDTSLDRTRITWFRINHPDWITYKNDRITPAWYPDDIGFHVPLDFTNAAVQDYMMTTYIRYAITTGGYQGVDFDQGESLNGYAHIAGRYATTTKLSAAATAGSTSLSVGVAIPVGTSIALGNGSDMEYVQVTGASGTALTISPALAHSHATGEWVGTWTQMYTGNTLDAGYRHATITAFQELAQKIKAVTPGATISINNIHHPGLSGTDQAGATAEQYWRDLIPYADIEVDECGYTHCGHTNPGYLTTAAYPGADQNPWATAMADYQWVNSQGKALLLTNYEPYQVTSAITTSNAQARFDCQWVLANYLMVKGTYTYLAWRGTSQVSGEVYREPEYKAQIGGPTGRPYQSQGVWMRDFTSGRVVVNPDTTSVTVSFPAGAYHDLYGKAVTTVTLPAHAGLVLLGTVSTPTSTPTSTPVPTSTPTPVPPTSTPTTIPTPTDTPILPTPTDTPSPTPLPCTTYALGAATYRVCQVSS